MGKALWNDVIGEAMEQAGVVATPEQIAEVASAAAAMHENYGQAVYTPESPLIRENAQLREAIQKERDRRHCRECDGRGSITSGGPGGRSSTSQCWKCGGEGKAHP